MCCSQKSHSPVPCITGVPVSPREHWSVAVGCEPSHPSMAAVGSLRREEGNKSPGTHELFTAVLSKQSAIIYLFSPGRCTGEPGELGMLPGLPSPAPRCLLCMGLPVGRQFPGDPKRQHTCPGSICVLCVSLEGIKPEPFLVLRYFQPCSGWASLCPKPQKAGKSYCRRGEYFPWRCAGGACCM